MATRSSPVGHVESVAPPNQAASPNSKPRGEESPNSYLRRGLRGHTGTPRTHRRVAPGRSRPRSHHRRRCSERLLWKHLRQQRRVSPGAAEGLEIVSLIVIVVVTVVVVESKAGHSKAGRAGWE